MHVNHKIRMDLTGTEAIPTLEMVCYDQLSRQVELELLCNGEAMVLPQDVRAVIHFRSADGSEGIYDTLADGSPAWSLSGNRLTVRIAPAVLQFAGVAVVCPRLIRNDRTVSTFPFFIQVHPGGEPGAGDSGTAGYFFLPVPASAVVGQVLIVASVDEQGRVTEVTTQAPPVIDYSFGVWGELYAQKMRVTSRFSTDSGIEVTFNNNRLRKVAAPQEDSDAANKAYVDKAIADAFANLEKE